MCGDFIIKLHEDAENDKFKFNIANTYNIEVNMNEVHRRLAVIKARQPSVLLSQLNNCWVRGRSDCRSDRPGQKIVTFLLDG